MSTLATFGASKDHARERAGLLSGGAAVGRLSGLGIGRLPEGGTRKKCAETTWSVSGANVVAQYPGMVVLEGLGGITIITVHAGPSDVLVKDKNGNVIGRVPGCGMRSFSVEFFYGNTPVVGIAIENMEGGEPFVLTGFRPIPPMPQVYLSAVTQPGMNTLSDYYPTDWEYFITGAWYNLNPGSLVAGVHENILWSVSIPGAVTDYELSVRNNLTIWDQSTEDWKDVVVGPGRNPVIVSMPMSNLYQHKVNQPSLYGDISGSVYKKDRTQLPYSTTANQSLSLNGFRYKYLGSTVIFTSLGGSVTWGYPVPKVNGIYLTPQNIENLTSVPTEITLTFNVSNTRKFKVRDIYGVLNWPRDSPIKERIPYDKLNVEQDVPQGTNEITLHFPLPNPWRWP